MRRLPLLCLSLLVLAGCSGSSGTSEFVRVWGTGEANLVDGNHLNARFNNPASVEVAANGTVFVSDFDNGAVRKIGTDGEVSTLVDQDNFSRPFGITMGADGSLYVQTDADETGNTSRGTIWRVDPLVGGATKLASITGRPRGLLGLPDGRLVFSDLVRHTINFMDATTGEVTLLAGMDGMAGFANGTGIEAMFNRPYGLALNGDGALLVADQDNNRIRRVTLGGVVSTFAGTFEAGKHNGPVGEATFNHPQDVAISGENIYVADTMNHLIRRITAGQVTTQAGTGNAGFIDAEGTNAEFFGLEGIAINSNGSILWIADGNGGEPLPFNRVRRLTVP
ncbi:MAG: hypothetical protein ACAH95_17795 [Fimbriimonas sp.]